MAKTEEPLTQLATRIPEDLHRTHDIMLQHFVVAAIEEKVTHQGRAGRRTRDEGTSYNKRGIALLFGPKPVGCQSFAEGAGAHFPKRLSVV